MMKHQQQCRCRQAN